MSDTDRLRPSGLTITIVLDISPPLRALLMQILHPPRAASADTVSRDAPVTAVAGKASQAVDRPGPAFLDVSSLENSPAASDTPPAPFQKPPRKQRATGGGRPLAYDTPERIAWLIPAWRDRGVTRPEAMVALNKFVGPPLTNIDHVTKLTQLHDIQRSPETAIRLQRAKTNAMCAARGKPASGHAAPPSRVMTEAPAEPSPPARPSPGGMSAAQVLAKRNGTASKPRAAAAIDILKWGAEHGCTQDKLDLDAMNAHCLKLGVATFELVAPKRRAA